MVMALRALIAIGLHLIPLFLLRGIEESADLGVRTFVDPHHLRAAVLMRESGIVVQGFHLGLLGVEDLMNFGLLIGVEIEFPGEVLGAFGRVHGAVAVMHLAGAG